MFLARINRHGRNVTLDLTPQCTPTNKNTDTCNHSISLPTSFSLSLSSVHTHAYTQTQMHEGINVVLNLAYYNRSANASWVNRCPGHSSSALIQRTLELHLQTHTLAHGHTCITTCLHILSCSDSSLQADYEVLSCFVFGALKLQ